jgi:hypothetical protein
MRKYLVYLFCVMMVFPSGCSAIKKFVSGGKSEEPKGEVSSPEVVVPPQKPAKVTTTTLSKLALYSLITLTILFGIRYIIKRKK